MKKYPIRKYPGQPYWIKVEFELEDFFGTSEQTLYCKCELEEGTEDISNIDILETYVKDNGERTDVWHFLTEDQKHDIRMQAWCELQPSPLSKIFEN